MVTPFERAGFIPLKSDFMDLDLFKKEEIALVAMHKFKDDKKAHRISGNHLDKRLFSELNRVFHNFSADQSVQGVILTSAHKVAFSRGAKIELLLDLDDAECHNFIEEAQGFVKAIQNFPKPIVAALTGLTYGGGLETAMVCDYRISSTRENVLLGLPEATLGIIPAMGGTQNLRRLIGESEARDIILKGRADLTPEEAEKLGLVDLLCTPENLFQKAYDNLKGTWTKKTLSPLSVLKIDTPAITSYVENFFQQVEAGQIIKEGGAAPLSMKALEYIYEHTSVDNYQHGLAVEKAVFLHLFKTNDCKEGIRALVEERPARFTGS